MMDAPALPHDQAILLDWAAFVEQFQREHPPLPHTDPEAAAAREGVLAFTRYTMPDYQVNWHHAYVAEALDQFVAGQIRRLMIFMPPRHGKSELVSRRLPAYILGHNPDAQIIACSYGADLAGAMNRDVQRIMDSDAYGRVFPGTGLNASNVRTIASGNYLRNSDTFEIVGRAGRYTAAGVGGAITGKGFVYGIIDDPIKNREEADSPTYRERVYDWYTSTFYSRQEKDARILLTVTRWHEDDLAGRLLDLARTDPAADQWVVLNFPALAEHPTPPDPRADGEPLWPSKYTAEQLATMRATMGSRDWAALYQQRPAPDAGALFRREQFSVISPDAVPSGLQWACQWDLAASTRTHADYTAGALVALGPDGALYIRDMARGRWEWPDTRPRITARMLAEPGAIHGIEKALHGLAAVQDLWRDPALAHVPLLAVDVDADKYSRALAWSTRQVRLVAGAWTEPFLAEVLTFPYGTNDDQVDTVSGGVILLARHAGHVQDAVVETLVEW